MTNRINKKWSLAAGSILLLTTPAWSQESDLLNMDALMTTDNLLLLVVAFLMLPIYALSKTLFFAMKMLWEKKEAEASSSSAAKAVLVLLALGLSQTAWAQAGEEQAVSYTWLILMVIAVQITVIAVLAYQVTKIMKMASVQAADEKAHPLATKESAKGWFATLWAKANNFHPIEKEGDLDVGHEYDGIRELDNPTPPWFTAAFVVSIIFAIVYLWVFHVSKTAPRQEEEYAIAVAKAEEQRRAFLASQDDLIDESNVEFLSAASDLAAGKRLYMNNCAVCHREDLGGSVGPNLVDDYWIHGGSISDVFKVVKYGVQEKGMMPWKDEYTPLQLAQVSSFVLSMRGSEPENPRPPQGEKYEPEDEEEEDGEESATEGQQASL